MTQTLSLDLTAPILPGVGAAGLTLGTSVETIPSALREQFHAQRIINTCIQMPTASTHYTAPCVEFWTTDSVIDQIRVGIGYRGSLRGHICPGATVAEAEGVLGPISEDDEDNLIFADLPGVVLDVALPPGIVLRTSWAEADPAITSRAVITAIYVYQPPQE